MFLLFKCTLFYTEKKKKADLLNEQLRLKIGSAAIQIYSSHESNLPLNGIPGSNSVLVYTHIKTVKVSYLFKLLGAFGTFTKAIML